LFQVKYRLPVAVSTSSPVGLTSRKFMVLVYIHKLINPNIMVPQLHLVDHN